jgi:hypothetical protein
MKTGVVTPIRSNPSETLVDAGAGGSRDGILAVAVATWHKPTAAVSSAQKLLSVLTDCGAPSARCQDRVLVLRPVAVEDYLSTCSSFW